ncbi:MAG TPA: glycoside hydrolase family 15 protein [Candidatus Saccharimonadales bacterium]|nr:glycoside hydrolase family 15 protein [Candidatus Saccharimonadales bacterium]
MNSGNNSSIKDYSLIGDLHSAALVSKAGSIDWLCLPHFDSPSIFARLLDPEGGSFTIETQDYAVSSYYIKDTAILETVFKSDQVEISIKDFMVPQPKYPCREHYLVRKITGIRGDASLTLHFLPRPSYASVVPLLSYDKEAQSIDVPLEENATLRLYLPDNAKVDLDNGSATIILPIKEAVLSEIRLEYVRLDESFEKTSFDSGLEDHTERFWEKWLSQGNFFPFCEDILKRSAITLKLLQFFPTGALVAAPTTSLPEEIGSTRNWDYRYVWIRDATFTLYAFHVLGFKEEAEKFFAFLQTIAQRSAEKDFELSLMYTIDGNPVPQEKELEKLQGYKNSKPVRIGNNAHKQFQLDIYGILIDAYYVANKRGITNLEIEKALILDLVKQIELTWKNQDRGMWEVRSGDCHFTYSKAMASVGVNRALRMSKDLGMTQEEIDWCTSLESEISDWIWANCYDENASILKQHTETTNQDATNFLLVLVQFLNKHDPRTKKIIDKTAEQLTFDDIFVYRYFNKDGLPRGEGAFLLCTFWYISALAVLEDPEKAHTLFHTFLTSMNDQGLLSEEMDPASKEYLGNYPQAFSHMGLIMAAYYISKYSKEDYHPNVNAKP